MSARRQLHAFVACAALLMSVGCQRHALDEKVEARNDLDFSMWLARQSSDLTAVDRKDLRDAVQQIKYTIMTASPGLTS